MAFDRRSHTQHLTMAQLALTSQLSQPESSPTSEVTKVANMSRGSGGCRPRVKPVRFRDRIPPTQSVPKRWLSEKSRRAGCPGCPARPMVPGDVCYEAPLLSIAAREKIYGPLKFNMGHSNPTKATQIHCGPLKSICGPLKSNMGHSNPTKATQIHHGPLKSPLHETA